MAGTEMKVVAYLPAQHRADCPAQDYWPCNCGAQPIPLIRLDAASRSSEDKGVPEGFLVALQRSEDLANRSSKIDRIHAYGRAVQPFVAELLSKPRATEAGTESAEQSPSTLAHRVAAAQKEVAAWSPEKRAMVQLQGRDRYAPPQSAPSHLVDKMPNLQGQLVDKTPDLQGQSAPVDGGGNV